jgi:hypothetical protein
MTKLRQHPRRRSHSRVLDAGRILLSAVLGIGLALPSPVRAQPGGDGVVVAQGVDPTTLGWL